MLVGLFLFRRNTILDDPHEAEAELVGYGKSLEEIKGWYNHHNTGAVDSPLKDYVPLEETMFSVREDAEFVGFAEITSLEKLQEQLQHSVDYAIENARELQDDYRNNIEPKAIHFYVNSKPSATIQ